MLESLFGDCPTSGMDSLSPEILPSQCSRNRLVQLSLSLHQDGEVLAVPRHGVVRSMVSLLILPRVFCVMAWALTEGCVLPPADLVEEVTHEWGTGRGRGLKLGPETLQVGFEDDGG